MSNYYREHAKEYIDSTIGNDLSFSYDFFLPHIPKGGSILDVGFGSGRDMLYFSKLGYQVRGIDIEPSFIEHALSLGLIAGIGNALDYENEEKFDGIWACASLLHLSKSEMMKAIDHLLTLLKPAGVLFLSLKEGELEGFDEKGRWMTYVKEKDFAHLRILDVSRYLEKERNLVWLNMLISK